MNRELVLPRSAEVDLQSAFASYEDRVEGLREEFILTVDNYQYTPGLTAVSGKIGTDSLGNIYAVGRGGLTVDSDERTVVRRSVDQGNRGSWEDYPEVGFHAGHYRAVAASEDNRLLVGGPIDSAWIIRESLDGGATWSLADDPAPFANDTGGGHVPTSRSLLTRPALTSAVSTNRGSPRVSLIQ